MTILSLLCIIVDTVLLAVSDSNTVKLFASIGIICLSISLALDKAEREEGWNEIYSNNKH